MHGHLFAPIMIHGGLMAKNHRIVSHLLIVTMLVAQLAPDAACPYCPPPPMSVLPSPLSPTSVLCPLPPASAPPSTPMVKCLRALRLLACVDALNGIVAREVLPAAEGYG
jgi:hypothetical protein